MGFCCSNLVNNHVHLNSIFGSLGVSRDIWPDISKLPSSQKRKSVCEWSLQREIANAPLSASLSNSPAYKIRLLIYNKKEMLNLVESGEDVTMRGK